MNVYLDSSAIVKRYLEEKGSESIDTIYDLLEGNPNQTATFSIWNLGEVLGVLDGRYRRGDIGERSLMDSVRLFAGETRKLVAMRRLNLLPISGKSLAHARDLVLRYHIYQADALQLAAVRAAKSDLFLSADKRLLECAELEHLNAANPERDKKKIAEALAK